jgi:arylsulfate sulfotransferase
VRSGPPVSSCGICVIVRKDSGSAHNRAMNSRSSAAAALVAALVLAACAGSDDDATTSDTDVPAPATQSESDVSDAESESDVSDAESDSEPVVADETDEMIPEPVAVSIEPSPYTPLAAAVSIGAELDVQVEVTATSDDHVVEVPRTAAVAAEHVIPLVGMRPDRTYAVSVESFDDAGASLGVVDSEFTTGPLPEWVGDHELTIDADQAAPGITIIEFDVWQTPEGAPSSQYLLGYDNDGEVVWYYSNTGALGGLEQTQTGTFLAHYWPFGIREIDPLGNVVNNWRPQPAETAAEADATTVDDEALLENLDPDQIAFFTDPLRGNPGDAEPVAVRAPWMDLEGVHHENWPMPNGNVLALATTRHEVTPEQRELFCPGDPEAWAALSDVIVEFTPEGEVVRTWDLWDVLDIEEFPGNTLCQNFGLFAESDLRDWTHANSVVYDPDRDAILISSRHTNQIIALNHLDDEGPQADLRWIIGDGATMPYTGDLPYYQHAVEVTADGAIVFYDNGNFRPGTSPDDPDNLPYSRAVIVDVDDASDDPAEWSAVQRWEHRMDETPGVPVYAGFISDADELSNGNVLITHGGIGTFPPDPEDPLRLIVVEVVPEGADGGDIVWRLDSAPGIHTAYRSERIGTFYVGDDWIPRG